MPTPDFILALREKIGHAPLWLPGVTAVVLDGTRVLLVRRADSGEWTPVTGIVDPEEQPARAAIREVLEETGVVAEAERIAGVGVAPLRAHANGDLAAYLDLTFRCRYVAGEAQVGDDESVEVGWFERDALPSMRDEFHERIAAALDDVPAAHFVR
ncbi:NUDIX hydrolase [Solicola gregarius]|uniref:NUDIX domain-containing protein n=1 Tax=Solicola gregarius TaxID=2908642 RepID=A0AA46TEE1_9ACTN|nr:NUDIX domain-containing protein [Solicola gregarius]UYM03819.1 NUDIX domain-containing protein [Solicola gregarius]